MPPRRYYKKTAQTFANLLCITHENDRQRMVVLEKVKAVMELFGEENLLFNPRQFASTIVEGALPGDARRQSEIIAEILAVTSDPQRVSIPQSRIRHSVYSHPGNKGARK